jgi:hypothetical protein
LDLSCCHDPGPTPFHHFSGPTDRTTTVGPLSHAQSLANPIQAHRRLLLNQCGHQSLSPISFGCAPQFLPAYSKMLNETPIRYLSPGNGQTKLGYFWIALPSGGDVAYHWETSRGADCLKNVTATDFQGTLQCDAYVAYGSFVKKHERHHPGRMLGPRATRLLRGARASSAALRKGSCVRSLISTASGTTCAAASQVQGNVKLCT